MLKKIKQLSTLFLTYLLFSCNVPQSRTGAQSFDVMNLSQEMLNNTIWCGPLTNRPANSQDTFMAVRFEAGKGGLARGRSREQAIQEVKKLTLKQVCQISGNKVFIPNFWDEGFNHIGGLGRINAEVIFTNNSSAKILMYYNTSPGAPLMYEVSDARKNKLGIARRLL